MGTVKNLIDKRKKLLSNIQQSIDSSNNNLTKFHHTFDIIYKFDSTKDFSNTYKNDIIQKYEGKKLEVENFNRLRSGANRFDIATIEKIERHQKNEASKEDEDKINRYDGEYNIIKNKDNNFFSSLSLGSLYVAFIDNIVYEVNILESDCNTCEYFCNNNTTIKLQKYKKEIKNIKNYKNNIDKVKNHQNFKDILNEVNKYQQNPFDTLLLDWTTILTKIVTYDNFRDQEISKTKINVDQLCSEIQKDTQGKKTQNISTPGALVVGTASWLEVKVMSQDITDIVLNYTYRSSYDYQSGSYSKEYILYKGQSPYHEDNSCWVIHIHWDNGASQNNQQKSAHAVSRALIKRWEKRKEIGSSYVIHDFMLKNIDDSLKNNKKHFPLGFKNWQWISGKSNSITINIPEEFISSTAQQKHSLPLQDRGPITQPTHTDQCVKI